MNEQHLVYSTLFGGVAIYERRTGKGSGDRPTFDLFEQLDFSGNKNILQYPNRDIMTVGFGNECWIFPAFGWMVPFTSKMERRRRSMCRHWL
mmetsp:Transcript_16720/g.27218  ORF Transcript_16720/g.27218 Transcript_16720/m.27218 type:complete len:92 (-) Transcript_16720:608-883(-)